jgi:hypothetical protein
MPDNGYEIIGTPTGTEGETQFSWVLRGKYIVETNAPGYLTVRRSMQIEAGHRQRILYVLMKARPVTQGAEKKQAETTIAATLPAGGNTFVPAAKPAVNGARDFWMVHELEQNVPPVDASVECPTQQVLKVGARMTEFVSNLEKFTATEELEHHRMDAKGEAEKRHFDYVVTVSLNAWGTFTLSEFRNGSTDIAQFPAGVATLGLRR